MERVRRGEVLSQVFWVGANLLKAPAAQSWPCEHRGETTSGSGPAPR